MTREDFNTMDELVKLSFFVEIGKAITRAKTIDETLHEIMQQIGHIFAPLNWSLLLKSPKTGELTFTVVVGKNADKLQGLRLPKGEGIAGWIAETGQSLIVEDVKADRRFSDRVDRYTGFLTESIIGVPLKTDQKVFGVIELINRLDGQPFTPFDLKVLTSVADFAAIAVEKAYYHRTLKRLASTDALTGLYNRGAFERFYTRYVEMTHRYETPLSLLMADLDGFKQINDTHGHKAGDRVLKAFAELLTDCVRKVDLVCRYGGDEFIIILPNTSEAQAMGTRKRIMDRLAYQNSLDPDIPFHASVGIKTVSPGQTLDTLELLDSDLYREKHKKYARRYDDVDQHLEDMLKEEQVKLHAAGRNRRN